MAAKASKTAYRRACSSAVKAASADGSLSLNDLLGPRQGMPRTKDKLILVAEALGIPSWGTVAEFSVRCKEAMGRTREQTRARPTPSRGAGAGPLTDSGSSAMSSEGNPGAHTKESEIIAQLQLQIAEMQRQQGIPMQANIAELTSVPEDALMEDGDLMTPEGWACGDPPFNDFQDFR